MSPESQSELTKSSELLEQAGMPYEPRSLTPPTPGYTPIPDLWDPPVNYYLQAIHAAGAAAEAEAAEILHQK